ncbi:hypothetical protein [Terrisporobacter mayombei]|uniref:DUF1206 domain-containing protein n=1 Tax=Terrisporobacter mayombei TaxID=1541 RepID=A0ABY9PYH1_9FIRM|nr:hypothetical protein [Terrisporobacter mayombei]MCC3867844.1 hypothetical protein [Terrisporobacter mayombei]WMT79976.1 hypothetical protein TEMA_02480 [Terrisporobacter mayombei]
MASSKSRISKKNLSDETNIQIKLLQNGRFATILFMIGCFLNFIEYNYSEKAILESASSVEEYNSIVLDNKLKSAAIAQAVSIIFLIAIIIFASDNLIDYKLGLGIVASDPSDNSPNFEIFNENSNNGLRIITVFSLVKVLGYLGAAIGYTVYLKELEESNS